MKLDLPYPVSFSCSIAYPTVSMAPRMDEASGTSAFPHAILGSVMIGMEHDLFTKFIKIKTNII